MPNIPIKSSPFKAPQKPPATPIKSLSNVVYSGVKTLPGGMKVTHKGSVIDNSSDLTQILPYLANCQTCNWQGRFKSIDSARQAIQEHVGF